jgi:thermolysin
MSDLSEGSMRKVLIKVLLVVFCAVSALAEDGAPRRVEATRPGEIRDWDARLEARLRVGELRVRRVDQDTLLPARQHYRLTQLHKGVPVYGGEISRQMEGDRTISIFGTLYEGIDIEPRPVLTSDQAAGVAETLSGASLGPARVPELVVLPRESGGYVLVYTVRVFTGSDLIRYFIDARTGELVLKRSEMERQSAVGTGTGVLSDTKKMSARGTSGNFLSDDRLRPPSMLTFDMRGDINRTIRFLNGQINLGDGDLGRDSDNVWTDGSVVDAHTYAGWTYDYYFKRYNRRGLDGQNLQILSLVHTVRRQDLLTYSDDIIGTFFLNAFYAGGGVMVYGEGLPEPFRLTTGQRVNFLAGSLDIVAHELTHGVTEFTSRLIYQGESGALNESFSDMMGVSAEFFFSDIVPGGGDWLLAEDTFTPGGIRSLQNPIAFGDPDHYSIRFLGSADNGGVHINSGIPNHMFYLAVAGGTNRVSRITVQGVGQANIEQIERVMFRAFTQMMPANANFATARAVTIQSARDLFGSGSNPERAVTQAWTAVGVN